MIQSKHMAKPKKEKVEEPAPAEVTQENAATPETPSKRPKASEVVEVTVCDPRGNPHRTYSLAVHGEKFAALAAEFIADRKGWTVR